MALFGAATRLATKREQTLSKAVRAMQPSSAILQRSWKTQAGNRLRSSSDSQAFAHQDMSSQQSEVNTMSKGMDAKKNGKKKPMKTAQEKRMAKRDKKSGSGTTLLGAHAATH